MVQRYSVDEGAGIGAGYYDADAPGAAFRDAEEPLVSDGGSFGDCFPTGIVFWDLDDERTDTLSAGDVFAQFYNVECPHFRQVQFHA